MKPRKFSSITARLSLALLLAACEGEPAASQQVVEPQMTRPDSEETQAVELTSSGGIGTEQLPDTMSPTSSKAPDSSSPSQHPESHEPSHSLQVLSYNVFHLPDIAAVMHYKEDFRAKGQAKALVGIAEQLDVVVFQEGFNKAAKQHLFDAIYPSFPHSTELVGLYCETSRFWDSVAGNCSNSLFVTNGGVKIVSRYPILEKHQYVFRSSGKGTADGSSNKGAVYVAVEKDGRKYHVVGTHLQADQGSFDGSGTRNLQMTELSQWISSFSIPKDEPIIYAGDMNVESTNQSAFADMKRLLASETLYIFDPLRATYSNVSNSIVKERYPDYNDTLDYILVSNQHRQPTVSSTIEIIRFQKENIDLSDHHAVLGRFDF